MEKFFKLKERKTTVKIEVMAGITTFLTMAYILAVNPGILSDTGMQFSKVFSATAISSAIATLIMALMANLPFALAPGMGLNAFLAYTVVLGMGYSWQFALTAVFVEGIIFIILTFVNVREAIINSIPDNIKKAIGVGIGLFIAFIGLQNAGIIVDGATLVSLNPTWLKGDAGLALLGLLITGVLLAFKVQGALLIGIIATTIIGIPFGITKYAGGSYVPPAPYFFPFEWSQVFTVDFVIIMFTFLFVDMFDTVGTLIGCATKADMIKPDGTIPNVKEALFADSVGTTVGAVLGTSTVTTFVESSAGVVEGGLNRLDRLGRRHSLPPLPLPGAALRIDPQCSDCTGLDPRRCVHDHPGDEDRVGRHDRSDPGLLDHHLHGRGLLDRRRYHVRYPLLRRAQAVQQEAQGHHPDDLGPLRPLRT